MKAKQFILYIDGYMENCRKYVYNNGAGTMVFLSAVAMP